MKKIVILQSNYIPWKGYFDLIAYADELSSMTMYSTQNVTGEIVTLLKYKTVLNS